MTCLSTLSDAQLVVAVAMQYEDALAETYRRHGGAVIGLARRIIGNAPEAEDVTQEIFLGLWRNPDRFDPSRGIASNLPPDEMSQPSGRSRAVQ